MKGAFYKVIWVVKDADIQRKRVWRLARRLGAILRLAAWNLGGSLPRSFDSARKTNTLASSDAHVYELLHAQKQRPPTLEPSRVGSLDLL
jgi:hypothetical protein